MISYTFDTPLPIPQAHCNNNNKQNWIKEWQYNKDNSSIQDHNADEQEDDDVEDGRWGEGFLDAVYWQEGCVGFFLGDWG